MPVQVTTKHTLQAVAKNNHTKARTIDICVAAHKLLIGSIVIDSAHLGQLDRTCITCCVELLGSCNGDGALHRNSGGICEVNSLVERQMRQRNSAVRARVAIAREDKDDIV